MAEGGPNQESVPKDGTQTDSHLLECPICLEQLHQPRCLPCHHSLCQECLSTYINSEVSGRRDTATTFTCPVCRTLTYPVDKTEDKEKWAEQFPVDKVVMELIQIKSGSTASHYCIPCKKTKDKKVLAQFWCKTTQCLFCESCKVNHHDIIHTNCDAIDIITSTDFLPRTETNSKRCDKHKKKITYYCVDHNSFGCSKCVTTGHRKCEEVATTEDYCETLDKDSKLVERTTYMKEAADSLESLVKNLHTYLQSIADDKESALQSIDDMEERFIQRMREMKKEITDDLIAKYKEESGHLKTASQKCERLKVAMQNTMESTVTARQKNDYMGTILLYQRGQTELDSWKDLVKEMRMMSSSVCLKHDAEFDGTSMNFGKIIVQKQQIQFTDVPGLNKPLSECELKEVRKMNIKMESDQSDCSAHGIVISPDGSSIVVGDYNNKNLKLINTDGDVVDELKVDGRTLDLCLVDNTTVAAAIGSGIHVVTVTSDKLTLSNVINIGKQCHGITYRNGEFIVSSGKEVYRVRKDGKTQILHKGPNTIYTLSQDHRDGTLFIPYYNHTPGSTAVGSYSLSTDNLHKDVLKVGVLWPYGVDVDGEGNVYVCGHESHNVVQMSGDGTNVSELLTSADGINSPQAISVCGDKVVVTNLSDRLCNYIHLYQLI